MITTHPTYPWLTEGGPAAIVTSRGTDKQVKLVTVDRWTKTQIVLTDDARRYRVDNLRQVGDHYGSKLYAANDTVVYDVRAAGIVDGLPYRVGEVTRKIRPVNLATARAALDQMEKEIAAARHVLDGFTH
ncbi:MAG TPA: hypothetical protein VF657_23940 [Actinoplanes sp.]|jgi:hypothetical protein